MKRKISDLQGTVQNLTTTVDKLDKLFAAHVKRQKSDQGEPGLNHIQPFEFFQEQNVAGSKEPVAEEATPVPKAAPAAQQDLGANMKSAPSAAGEVAGSKEPVAEEAAPVTKAAPAAPQDVAGSNDAVADEAAPKAKGGVAGRTDCGNTSGDGANQPDESGAEAGDTAAPADVDGKNNDGRGGGTDGDEEASSQ